MMVIICVMAITGAGIVTGLLFAFSNFIIRALSDLPAESGMSVMQRVNEKIINPVFLVFFFGTPFLCVLVAIRAALTLDWPGNVFLLAGAIAYLAGPFGITVLFNVPLNNLLAKSNLSEADEIWPAYQKRWQFWNHIRTYIGMVSIILLAFGLGAGYM